MSDEDAAALESIVKDIYLDRSLDAHGRQLLEALECLLDPQKHNLTKKQAWDKARAAVRAVRTDYNGYEYPEYP